MAELEDVAAELYGLPLDEFTAARDERAKELRADGERTAATAVRALRRPSTAAWAVNQLVRARREEVEQVLDLGAALREAQAALAGDELRALRKQQQQLVAAVVRQTRAVARERGQRLSDTVQREVEATLKAAMADVDAAAAVRSGLLLRSLENTGFTSVDLDGAVALPEVLPAHGGRPQLRVVRDEEAEGDATADGGSGRARTRAAGGRKAPSRRAGTTRRRHDAEPAASDDAPAGPDEREQDVDDRDELAAERRRRDEEKRRREEAERRRREEEERRRRQEELRRARAEAEAAVEEAEARRAKAQEALDDAERTVGEIAHRRGEVRELIADLRRRLDEAEREDDEIGARLTDARSSRDDAASALRTAARAVDKARARLDELDDA